MIISPIVIIIFIILATTSYVIYKVKNNKPNITSPPSSPPLYASYSGAVPYLCKDYDPIKFKIYFGSLDAPVHYILYDIKGNVKLDENWSSAFNNKSFTIMPDDLLYVSTNGDAGYNIAFTISYYYFFAFNKSMYDDSKYMSLNVVDPGSSKNYQIQFTTVCDETDGGGYNTLPVPTNPICSKSPFPLGWVNY